MKRLYCPRRCSPLVALLACVLLSNLGMVPLLHLTTSAEAQALVSAGRSVLPGQVSPLLEKRPVESFITGNQRMDLSIALQMRHQADLDALLKAQNDPSARWYHHYLTPQDFTRQFGADPTTIQQVSHYVQQEGLRVTEVSPNRLFMNVSGPLPSVERAFAVRIARYKLGARFVYAPTTSPSLPSALAGMVIHIGGLDNIAHYQSSHPSSARQASPQIQGHTPAQLRTAYALNPLLKDGEDGTGQTLALVELDGFNPHDIENYYAAYQLGTPRYSTVLIDGATNVPRYGAVEAELDMEVAAAIAPGIQERVYIGQNSELGLNDLYNSIVNENKVKIISTSWGVCETAIDASENQVLSNIFEQAAVQGQTFFASAGDAGAYDCQNYSLAVDSPANVPYVVSVGGTSLAADPATGEYQHEKAWSCPNCANGGPYGTGGGGGVSKIFVRPSYQSGPGIYSFYRSLPDVSADADPSTGYLIYCSVLLSGCPASGWVTVGGTSAAAPLWAAFAIELEQYMVKHQQAVLGNLAPLLYTLYASQKLQYPAFHDITEGNNLYYSATVNYDLATGIGTLIGWNLVRDLATYMASARSVKGKKAVR